MSRTLAPLVIDARPRGPSGPFAGETVLGRSVIEHLLELAEAVGGSGAIISIHARENDHARILTLLAARPSHRYRLALGSPPEGALVLRTDRLYDSIRLKRAVRRGFDPESAVIWRLDRPHALAGADDEMTRRRSYQPLGRYWAAGPAIALARRLAPTRVRPNGISLASGGFMLVSAGLVALAREPISGRILPAVFMAVALVLDTADGHLARLQGTASEFGRWLDANLDELGDLALHAAIAWASWIRYESVAWLLLGMFYMMSKYMFHFGHHSAPFVPTSNLPSLATNPGVFRRIAHAIGHADLRWHLWIVLAAVGRLEIGLVVYTAYFLARSTGGAIRKAGAYAS